MEQALSPQLRTKLGLTLSSSKAATADHATWHTYQRLQASNPIMPNHDPLSVIFSNTRVELLLTPLLGSVGYRHLGTTPPDVGLVPRRKVEKGGRKGYAVMPLPKKVDLRHPDEL